MAEMNTRYCISLAGITKLLAIVFSAIILFFICGKSDGPIFGHWHDYEMYTIIVSIFTIVIELSLLVTFFLNCHTTTCANFRCRTFTMLVYILYLVLWLVAGGVQIYVTIQIKDSHFAGGSNAYTLRASSAALCFANALIFIASIQQARTGNL